MTKNLVTRALMIVGLLCVGTMASFAQNTAHARRVAAGKEDLQPVAASAILVDGQGSLAKSASTLNLSASQRTAIANMSTEAAGLQAERSRLWAEYRALIARPDFSDELAAAEAAPRMLRIVAINTQLKAIVDRQETQLNSILTPSQRTAVASMVSKVKASF